MDRMNNLMYFYRNNNNQGFQREKISIGRKEIRL